MSSTTVFNAIGDFLTWTFQLLQNDLPLTFVMNTGIVLLGFVGLFYWLNIQRKLNSKAANDPNQLK